MIQRIRGGQSRWPLRPREHLLDDDKSKQEQNGGGQHPRRAKPRRARQWRIHKQNPVGQLRNRAQLVRLQEEMLHQVLGPLIPVLRILGHHACQDTRNLVGDLRIELTGIDRADVLVMMQLFGGGPLRDWRVTGEDVVEGATQRIDITADVGVARFQSLFGRYVVEGAQRHTRLRQGNVTVCPQAARQAHVDELGSAVGGDDDVRRLDVAMDDAALGRVG